MKHFYFSSFMAVLLSLNSFGQCFPAKPSVDKRDTTRIRIRCGVSIIYDKPLYIIDGVIAEERDLKNIDPNNIESIEILKDATAAALYCDRGRQAVVIITTQTKGTIKIRDSESGEPIPAATVDLIYGQHNQHSIRLLADSLGQVKINDIKRGTKYELQVSNIGYKTYSASVNPETVKDGYSVSLQRNYADLKEVVVIAWPTISCRNLTYCSSKTTCDCLDEIKTKKNTSIDTTNAQGVQIELKFYPNPVLRSQQVNIEFENVRVGKITLRLFSFDGRSIGAKEYETIKGINKISYSINAQLAAGTYAIHLIGENNRLIKTEKLIIQ